MNKYRVSTVRRQDAEASISLTKRRRWYTNITPPAPEFDQRTLDHIEDPAKDAEVKAKQLAADEKYTYQHKAQQIRTLFSEARVEVENRYKGQKESTEGRIASLEKKVRLAVSPNPEDAQALLYSRDLLQARLKEMRPDEIKKLWEDVLTDGDMIAARVLYDFGHTMGKMERGRPLGSALEHLLSEVRTRTEEMLLTPEQRTARKELKKEQQTLQRLTGARDRALRLLSPRFQIQGTQYTNGDDHQRREHIRSMF